MEGHYIMEGHGRTLSHRRTSKETISWKNMEGVGHYLMERHYLMEGFGYTLSHERVLYHGRTWKDIISWKDMEGHYLM